MKRSLIVSTLFIGGICTTFLSAAPAYRVPQSNQLSFTVEDLRHEVENHEVELRMFEERLNTQETILDSLREQMLEAKIASKELAKGNTVSYESTVASLKKSIQKLQTHANDSAKAVNQYKTKISALESQMDSMQETLKAVMDALQVDNGSSAGKIYQVKSGDSLGIIADRNRTSVSKLKKLNNLKNDRIFPGQKIKIP